MADGTEVATLPTSAGEIIQGNHASPHRWKRQAGREKSEDIRMLALQVKEATASQGKQPASRSWKKQAKRMQPC